MTPDTEKGRGGSRETMTSLPIDHVALGVNDKSGQRVSMHPLPPISLSVTIGETVLPCPPVWIAVIAPSHISQSEEGA